MHSLLQKATCSYLSMNRAGLRSAILRRFNQPPVGPNQKFTAFSIDKQFMHFITRRIP